MRRFDRLQQRRIDESVLTARMANEAYRAIKEGESIKYAIGAMQPIDPEYTENTFREGERVRNQLQNRLTESCEYAFQGSTTNDTHIKAKSDIDLLVLINRWCWLEDGVPNPSPYTGDPKTDLRNLRGESEQAVRHAFPEANTDTSKSTAITVEGASLRRRVDVVPATWFDTMDYHRTRDQTYRGVKVFDKNTGLFSLNRPFLFNHRVDEKDRRTFGGLRKAARLMKSLAYDSDGRLDMTSYNITSIAWTIPDVHLQYVYPHEIRILETCKEYCTYLKVDSHARTTIRVPDDSRTLFGGDKGATVAQLDALIRELDALINDIMNEAQRSFKALAEARVEYMVR